MKRKLSLIAFIFLCTCASLAQITGGSVNVSGAVTAGHCTSFLNSNTIQDAGGSCGGTPSLDGVTNPAANKSFDMTTKTLNFNFTGNWGAGFGYSVTSNGSNASTGPLFQLSSGASTSHDVFQACAQGTTDCVKMTSAATFGPTGAASLVGNMNPNLFGKAASGFSPWCFVDGTTNAKISDCVTTLNNLGVTGSGIIFSNIPEDINYPTLFATNPKFSGTLYLSNDLGAANGTTCTQTAPFTCWLVTGPLVLPSSFSIRSMAGPANVTTAAAGAGGINRGSILSFDTTAFPPPIGSITGAGATIGTPACTAGGGTFSDGTFKLEATLVNNLMSGSNSPKTPGRGVTSTESGTVTCNAGTGTQKITWAFTNAPAVGVGYTAQEIAVYITATGAAAGTETEASAVSCSTSAGTVDVDGGACRLPGSIGTLTFTITGGQTNLAAPPAGDTDNSNPLLVLGNGPDTGNAFATDVRDITFNGTPDGATFAPLANEPSFAILGYTAQEQSGGLNVTCIGSFLHGCIYSGYNSHGSRYTGTITGSNQGPNTGNYYSLILDGRMLQGGTATEITGTYAAHCSGATAGTCGGSGGGGVTNPTQILILGSKAYPALHSLHTESAHGFGIEIGKGASAVISGYDGFATNTGGTAHAVLQVDSDAGRVVGTVHDDTGNAHILYQDDTIAAGTGNCNSNNSYCYTGAGYETVNVNSGEVVSGNLLVNGTVTSNKGFTVASLAGTAGGLGLFGGTSIPTPVTGSGGLLGPASAVTVPFWWQMTSNAESATAGVVVAGAAASHVNGLTITTTLPSGTAITNASLTTPTLGAATYTSLAAATSCAADGTAAATSIVTCSAAPVGTISCDPAATGNLCTINTTAVTTNSKIFIQPTEVGGGLTGCGTTADTALTKPRLHAIVDATSFTLNLGTFATKLCFDYKIEK